MGFRGAHNVIGWAQHYAEVHNNTRIDPNALYLRRFSTTHEVEFSLDSFTTPEIAIKIAGWGICTQTYRNRMITTCAVWLWLVFFCEWAQLSWRCFQYLFLLYEAQDLKSQVQDQIGWRSCDVTTQRRKGRVHSNARKFNAAKHSN